MINKTIHGNTKVIICNSPPQSGKDELVKFLHKKYNVNHLAFKTKLVQLTKLIYNVSDKDWDDIYISGRKDEPSHLFNGKSARQALIFVSEVVIKPKLGKEYFGKDAASQLLPDIVNGFSDGGFKEEILEVVNVVGKENCIIVRIDREGCNFSEDSRGYVTIEGVKQIDVDNNGTLEDFHIQIENIYRNLTND